MVFRVSGWGVEKTWKLPDYLVSRFRDWGLAVRV